MKPAVMDLFASTGAYLQGHFRLTSGLHSGEYLQCAKVLAYPDYAGQLGRDLAEAMSAAAGGTKADLVMAPALGGLIIGHEVARALGVPFLFTERDAATGHMTLRRGFEIAPGQRVFVVEDVITTGGSTREVIEVVRSAGAQPVVGGSIIDRSNGRSDIGIPRVALHKMNVVAYEEEQCPFCRDGIPVVKPGSRQTGSRQTGSRKA